MIKKSVLRFFGIESKGVFADALTRRFQSDIIEDINDDRMIILTGMWGAGKSVLFKQIRQALCKDPDNQPIIIRVADEERTKMRIASILSAILMNEEINPAYGSGVTGAIRRGMEARSLQAITLLGEARFINRRKIYLYIENAHELHLNTVRAINRFLENEYRNTSHLLSVILIGQPSLASKIQGCGELYHRVSMYQLDCDSGWLAYERRVKFLQTVYGGIITTGGCRRCAMLQDNFLGMDGIADKALTETMKLGEKTVTEDAFEIPLDEMVIALSQTGHMPSQRDIAKESNLPLATVNAGLKGVGKPENLAKIKAALQASISADDKAENVAPVRQAEEVSA